MSDHADDRVDEEDERVRAVLDRAYELAALPLEGIDEAAMNLADLAGGDGRVIERAILIMRERVRVDPNHANKQVHSLVRRAIELAMFRWAWDDTKPVP